ncbi:MAG TPA: DUF4149 domain-containing protein [Balneolaceae bacterium]|nr:DUF4149 domain-containing protein [Balneolaceae bacterium]
MFIIYKTAVFIHIISAIFWLGGILFTAGVLVPATRHKLLSEHRGTFFALVGEKFSRISWVLFVVLIITGIVQLLARGFTVDYLLSSSFWNSNFGSILGIKLSLFAIVLVISGLHDFWLGPKAVELMNKKPNQNHTRIYQKASRWAGRLNLILGLLILYFAITLVRG